MEGVGGIQIKQGTIDLAVGLWWGGERRLFIGEGDVVRFTEVNNKPKETRRDGRKTPKDSTVIHSKPFLDCY